ncbi:MAG: hypothetical protein HZA03_11420 [Nitrospinae bacterium]|nr:hypothetical protein [Nitrospinota bacterium]
MKELPRMPDFLDLKDPHGGSLGMPMLASIEAVRAAAGDAVTLSAAIGDAAYEPEFYAQRAVDAALAGADIVKVGLKDVSAEQAPWFLSAIRRSLDARAPYTRIVAGFYADLMDDAALKKYPAAAQSAGVWGCLIDTYDKSGKRLGHYCGPETLAGFTADCRARGLKSALAGGLMEGDLIWLDEAEPDIVGFRSAVAKGKRHESGIDPKKATGIFFAVDQLNR